MTNLFTVSGLDSHYRWQIILMDLIVLRVAASAGVRDWSLTTGDCVAGVVEDSVSSISSFFLLM